MNRILLLPIAACVLAAPTLEAQSFYLPESRQDRWEFGVEAVYENALDIAFRGGSSAAFDDAIGFTFGLSRHLTEALELRLALSYMDVDYDANIVSADQDGLSGRVRGTLERITPSLDLVYNFLEADLTPYVSAGIGWSFLDSNIPDGPPGFGCWWDPWLGYICTPYQSTRTSDEFSYQAGVGLRWDVSAAMSLRLGYEKQWLDVGTATSTPDLDLLKLGIGFKY